MWRAPSFRFGRLVVGLCLFAVACGDPPASKVSTSGAPSAGKDPNMGGKLDEAAKSLDGKSSASPSAAANQPPPNGIFAKGGADAAHKAGAPPKLELVGDGQDPKVLLHASAVSDTQVLPLRVSLKIGQDSLPPLDLKVHVGPPGSAPVQAAPSDAKPAGKKPSAGASASAASSASAGPAVAPPAAPGADRPLVVTIIGATVAGAGEGDVPKPLKQLLDAMKGGTIDFTMTKTGPSRFARKFATAPDAQSLQLLDLEFGAIEDTLTAMYTPAPEKPVGEGAFWMVTDRRSSYGSDVVRYRLFRVVKIDGDQATLSIELRQYAADPSSTLLAALGMPDAVMGAYAVDGKGVTLVVPNSRWPNQGLLQQRMAAQVMPPGAEPNAPSAREFRIEVNVQLGGDEEAAPGLPAPGKPPAGGKTPR